MKGPMSLPQRPSMPPVGADVLGRPQPPHNAISFDRGCGPPRTSAPTFWYNTLVNDNPYPTRKQLEHATPFPAYDAFYFVTICAAERGTTMLSDNASVILDAVRHYQRIGKWFVTLFLIMPDHIHMLVHVAMARAAEDVGPYLGLSTTIGDFKAYLSKAHHIGFQRNFFDTRIRDAAHYAEKWKYICLNPVARGLVSTPREWPHSLAFDRETGAERPHR